MFDTRISTGTDDPVYAGVIIGGTYSGVKVVRDDATIVITLDIADGQAFEVVTTGPVVIKHMRFEPPTPPGSTASIRPGQVGGGGGGSRRY